MNCDERNQHFATGNIDRDDLWPKVKEYESARFQFRFEFGLDELPKTPGLITIRGARQYGKSTWLELQLLDTLEDFGKGSAYIMNGDEIYSHDEFEKKLLNLEKLFSSKTKVKRIFIDEITAIPSWEKVIKRLIDAGRLKDVLIITTGSNASDLRHGSERLPGRKGKLSRHDYLFLPISYKEYRYQTRGEMGMFDKDSFLGYLLTGGSPVGILDLYRNEYLTENFCNMNKDWLIGDITQSGRNKFFALNLLRKIYEFGSSRVSYTKLAKEAGLANNTAALDYIEKLNDLLILSSSMQWDHVKKVFLGRKPSKFNFINLSAAIAFHPRTLRHFHEIDQLKGIEKASIYEWLVAQELWRRENLKNQKNNIQHGLIESLGYWASDQHEIDFVTSDETFYEVKAGQSSPQEFLWFNKIFPKKKLNVICQNEFETTYVQGIPFEAFLLSAESDLYYDEEKM